MLPRLIQPQANSRKIWAFETADEYIHCTGEICQVLNETVEEQWDDSFTRALRRSLVRSIVSPQSTPDYIMLMPSFSALKQFWTQNFR